MSLPLEACRFGDLPVEYASWEVARFVILQAPYDATTSYYSGTRWGPRAILEASRFLELYDEELEVEVARAGICTLAAPEPLVEARRMVERLQGVALSVVRAGKIPVLLGGEHTLTLGVVRALREQYPQLGVLQLDAHGDLRDRYMGTPYSHACVARRLAEEGPLVQVGIRSLSREEAAYLRRHKAITTFYAHHLRDRPHWIEEVATALPEGPLYITIDLDVLDPSEMPAVGTPEPGGLRWAEVLSCLRRICQVREVVGFDLMELCPLPGHPAPNYLAARLAYKLMGYVLEGRGELPRS